MKTKLSAPLNESAENHYSVVSETYDLLQALNHPEYTQQTCQVFKDRFMLFRGSSYAPLREARIRSFKPILKNSFQADQTVNAKITVKPYVFDYDADYRYPISKTFNAYDLFNSYVSSQNISDVQLRVSPQTYNINFSTNVEQTVSDINNCVRQYFHQYDENGTFNFTDGVHDNYIRNYGQEPQPEDGINYTHTTEALTDYTVLDVMPVREGVYVYALSPNSGTGSAFAVCKPEELDDEAAIYAYSSSIDNYLISAVATYKDCETVLWCDFTNLYVVRNGVFTHILKLEGDMAQFRFKFLASNDKNVLVVLEKSSDHDKYYYYLLNGYSLVPIEPHYNDGTERNLLVSAIRGYNGGFICYVISETNSRLEICNRDMTEWEVIEPSMATGVYNISKIDVINKIDEIYVAAVHAVDGGADTISFYQYEKQDEGVYEWVSNGTQLLGDYVYSMTHHGGYFLLTTQISSTETDVYKYPAAGGTETVFLAITTDNDVNGVYVSGGYEQARVVSYKSNAATIDYWISEIIPVNDDVLTISAYKDFYNYAFTEIELFKFRVESSGDPGQPTIYAYDLMIPLTTKLLMFSVSLETEPIALLYSNENESIFNNVPIVAKSYLNTRNEYINYSPTYDEDIKRLEYINDDYGLTLYSDHMNNVSQIIYTGYTEANVVYKRFDCLPSTNYLTVYLKDVESQVPTKNKLNELYSRIIVEIDYVYESV